MRFIGTGKTARFCDGRTYAVLYAAGDFATAFAEVVVRNRLVRRDRRLLPFGDVAARGWVEFRFYVCTELELSDSQGQ
jgi:hypothetical protein